MKRLVAVAIAQLADLVTFMAIVSVAPIAGEANPIVRAAYSIGPIVVLTAKLLVLLALVWATDRVTPRYRTAWSTEPARWIQVGVPSIAIGAGLAGAVANLTALVVVLLGVVR